MSFNRVRSNIKVKEYAAGGVPWLGSPIGPYKELGAEQGGRLVPDYGWGEALTDLVSDARRAPSLAERAAAWGPRRPSRQRGEWEAVFAEAAERAGRVADIPAHTPSGPASPVVTGSGGPRSRTIVPRPIPSTDASARDGDGAVARFGHGR